jgi:hypothetical protein
MGTGDDRTCGSATVWFVSQTAWLARRRLGMLHSFGCTSPTTSARTPQSEASSSGVQVITFSQVHLRMTVLPSVTRRLVIPAVEERGRALLT